MAAAGKRHGYGSSVSYDTDGAGAGAVTLTELVKVKSPKASRAKVDATNLSSTANYREYLPLAGWKDTDEYTFDSWYEDTQVPLLVTLFEAGTERYFYIKLPLATGQATKAQIVFKGFVSSYEIQEISNDDDAPIRVSWAIQRTSDKITFTAAT